MLSTKNKSSQAEKSQLVNNLLLLQPKANFARISFRIASVS